MSTTNIVISGGTYSTSLSPITIDTDKYPGPFSNLIVIDTDKYAGSNTATSALIDSDKWTSYSYTHIVMSNFVWNGIMPEGIDSLGMVKEIIGYTGHWVAINNPDVYNRYLQQNGWDSNLDSGWARWVTRPTFYIHFCGLGIDSLGIMPYEAWMDSELDIAMKVKLTGFTTQKLGHGGAGGIGGEMGAPSVGNVAVSVYPRGFDTLIVPSNGVVQHV